MINRLLSNLPFNPSLIEDVSFYAKRLRQEESIRRTGIILVSLSMFVQIFAAMVPAEKSFAASSNDVIRGGVNTLPQLKEKCENSNKNDAINKLNRGAADLYARFGLSCAKLVPESCAKHDNKRVCNVDFNFQEMGKNGVKTVGREPVGGASCNLGPYGEHKVSFCERTAATWSGSAAAYDFGVRKDAYNSYYHVWILKDCGNIAYVAVSSQDKLEADPIPNRGGEEQQQARPEVACSRLTADRTSGKKSVAVRFTAEYSANLPNLVNGISFDFGDGNRYRHNGTVIDYTYTNNSLATREYIASVTINSTIGDFTGSQCRISITVLPELCENNPTIKPDDPACGICPYDNNLAPNDPRCKPPVCENDPTLTPDDPRCKCPSDPSISAIDVNCGTIGKLKKVENITQKLNNDQSIATKVKAGDVLEYTLISTNTNYVVAKDSVLVEDSIGDILDYMNLDEEFLKTQGGTFDKETKTVSWTNQTIPANGQISKAFRVVAKNPFPSTNQPNATAPDYDCKIENGYGNEIVLGIECPTLKTIESLPNTGPGTTVGIAVVVTIISGYFFARSRLLAKELDIVKKEYATSTL